MGVYLGVGTTVDDYSAMQGPCASGFHIPLQSERNGLISIMNGLGYSGNGNAYRTKLHIPFCGFLDAGNSVQQRGTYGKYYTSTADVAATSSTYIIGVSLRSNVASTGYFDTISGSSIRPFKDGYIIPTASWTVVDGTLGGAGIFWNSTDGIISVTSNGTTGYTIADKNLGATTVYNDGATLSESNCGKYYQRGNNYGFPFSGATTTSSTKVADTSSYGPGNYYSSSTFILYGNNWMSDRNNNLRGGTTGVQPKTVYPELKNAYIGEVGEYIISNIPTDDSNVYVNVAKSGKTVDTITFNAVVNYVSEKDCFMFIASNASNTNRYGLQYRARSNTDGLYTGTGLYIRGRLNGGSESTFRKSTNGYSTSSNIISYTINRNGSCSFTCNGQTTSYIATGSELTMLQTIINSSSVTVYSSQEASVISGSKVDVTVTYS